MPLAAAGILAGGSLLSGLFSGNSSQKAAETQAAAANQATQTQLQEFQQVQNLLAPYVNTGTAASNQLYTMLGGGTVDPRQSPLGISPTAAYGPPPQIGNMPGYTLPQLGTLPTFTAPQLGELPVYNFPGVTAQQAQNTPGYQFQLDQMMRAVQNSGAARGGAFSGNTLNALQTNAQGLASTDYWNTYNAAADAYNKNYQSLWNNVNTRYGADYQNSLANYTNAFNNVTTKFGADTQNSQADYNFALNNLLVPYNAETQSYWNQYNAFTGQQNNIANILNTLANRGTVASGNVANAGLTTAQQIGANQIGAGNAVAAGQIGQGAAIGNSINSLLTQLQRPAGGTNLLTQLQSPIFGGSNNSGAGNNNTSLLSMILGSNAAANQSNYYQTPAGAYTLNNMPDFGSYGYQY